MGKLGTTTVNGPEGDVVTWDAVDWRQAEGDVRAAAGSGLHGK